MAASANKDFEVAHAPSETVSELAFSSQGDFLAASSWDSQTRIWEVLPTGNAEPKAMFAHEAPALCVAWSPDGTKVLSGGCDKAGRMLDLLTGQSTQVAAHDEAIRCCKFISDVGNMTNMFITGSWDKTARYWDLRSPTPAHTLVLPERCYAIDVSGPLMVIGTADRQVQVYDLNNPSVVFKQIESPLKFQTRTVTCLPTRTGFALGSVEGRIAIHKFEPADSKSNFIWKCHRIGADIYPVNCLSFHPVFGTSLLSAGSDGEYNIWDIPGKKRIRFGQAGAPVTAAAFNRGGTILAYSAGSDWVAGHENYQPGCKIFLHAVAESDVKPRS
ncbi:WD40-repeat-containing domain protein [Blyttiomyces helicus]|uniref:WD40-repeat-containing domain protein n=1 Tax=Blyttiomyces helicus TaxID=388810 RepID=A0A4P9WCY4_9FUNG|nr:WD40-repeat-containing domain protein [Blyttiomyces helicus]|eukprot:RKO90374.1 WD40-repeat-containing domain protein [Blyttiomyces helicus]